MKTHIFGSGDKHIYIGISEDSRSTAEEVFSLLRKTSAENFRLIFFEVKSWNDDFSPWKAPAVFGNEDFGGNAGVTLKALESSVVPSVEAEFGAPRERFIAGYSLSGLFALWSCFESSLWNGAASCSGSLWFPKFLEYTEKRPVPSGKFYFSLGDKEAKTKNKAMSSVEDITREIFGRFDRSNPDCTLEMNSGGHFKDCDLRLAKGIDFLISQEMPQ